MEELYRLMIEHAVVIKAVEYETVNHWISSENGVRIIKKEVTQNALGGKLILAHVHGQGSTIMLTRKDMRFNNLDEVLEYLRSL